MLYPSTPFEENFNYTLLLNSEKLSSEDAWIQNKTRLQSILKWLCTSPKISSYRVNTLLYTTEEIKERLKENAVKISENRNIPVPNVYIYNTLPEVVIVHSWDITKLDLIKNENEIIVDIHCGAAILRGAHIFAPGILGMLSGTKLNDKVSIYVDVSGKCKRGLNKLYECPKKIFIGKGICKMTRHQLFGANLNPTGIGVEITDTISGCLPLNENYILPENSFLLQNIPSVICVRALNPSHGDVILDMCASPGNKTTHIADLLKNMGILIAIDKTPSKIKRLEANCNNFNANVHIFQADSTKIFNEGLDESRSVIDGPPFRGESFDKILLDAPCSALGKRPQFPCKINNNILKSFVPLQRKLFEMAVKLLKSGGTLVYSTCTITVAENEEIVAWALKKFSSLKLVKPEKSFGTRGFFVNGLNEEQLSYLQRFDSDCDIDSVGFFIACFIKHDSNHQ